MGELPTIAFPSAAAWDAWLDEHHATSDGVWLQLAKKGTDGPSVTYAEALEVALCHGWIDGQKAGLDGHAWRQKFTPRRARSRWSQVNRDKAVELERGGRMRPAGRREVERAKADGRWAAAYAPQRTATVPADLQAALDADDRARAFFATLDRANRYAILYRVQDAKRPETRARRVAQYVAMLAEHRKLHP